MASNGYVRSLCSRCIFYSNEREYGYRCTLRGEVFDSELMRWISANDCDRSPLMREKYYEKCEHYTGIRDIKNQVREKFGIEKWNYNY